MPYREQPLASTPTPTAAVRLPRAPMTKDAYRVVFATLVGVPAAVILVLALELQPELSGAILGLWLCAIVGWIAWARRRAAAGAPLNTQAVHLIGEGEPEKAAAMLDELIAQGAGNPVTHSIYLLNRGIAALQMGRLDDARTMLKAVHAGGWFESRRLRNLVPTVSEALGRVEVLAGNLDEAERWQRTTHARLTSQSRVTALQLDVLIALRRGKLADAEALCQASWSAAEGRLSAREMKRLRVLRAFTASLRAPDDPSAGSAVTAWLAGVKPARAALFSYLGVQWPEFAAFEGQHLADVESAAAPTAGSVTPP